MRCCRWARESTAVAFLLSSESDCDHSQPPSLSPLQLQLHSQFTPRPQPQPQPQPQPLISDLNPPWSSSSQSTTPPRHLITTPSHHLPRITPQHSSARLSTAESSSSRLCSVSCCGAASTRRHGVAGAVDQGLSCDHAHVHGGRAANDGRVRAGPAVALLAVLLPPHDRASAPVLAPADQLLLLRRQLLAGLPLPHVLPRALLPRAGGGILPRPHRRLLLPHPVRRRADELHRAAGAAALPRLLPHLHDGVHLGKTQPVRTHELSRTLHIYCTLPAVHSHSYTHRTLHTPCTATYVRETDAL